MKYWEKYTDRTVYTSDPVPEWDDEKWDQLAPFCPEYAGSVHTEQIRQRHHESSPRYVVRETGIYRGVTPEGKRYDFAKTRSSRSYKRTKDGLVLSLEYDPISKRINSTHLFSENEPRMLRRIYNAEALREVIGQLPVFSERYPLADGTGASARFLNTYAQQLSRRTQSAFLDAQDYAQVVKGLYGKRNYRKPLVNLIQQAPAQLTDLLTVFRSLVPIDWIVEAYRTQIGHDGQRSHIEIFDDREHAILRKVLRELSLPVRKRLLNEIVSQEYTTRLIKDTVYRFVGEPELFDKVMAQGDLSRVRSFHDLHQVFIARLAGIEDSGYLTPTQKLGRRRSAAQQRARHRVVQGQMFMRHRQNGDADMSWGQWMADAQRREAEIERIRAEDYERQQAERLQRLRERDAEKAADLDWVPEISPQIDGRRIETQHTSTLTLQIAKDRAQLIQWSETMENCIRDYHSRIGEILLLGVTNSEGDMIANAEIHRSQGIVQMLGRYNNTLRPELFHGIAAALQQFGIGVSERCWGRPRQQPVHTAQHPAQPERRAA